MRGRAGKERAGLWNADPAGSRGQQWLIKTHLAPNDDNGGKLVPQHGVRTEGIVPQRRAYLLELVDKAHDTLHFCCWLAAGCRSGSATRWACTESDQLS